MKYFLAAGLVCCSITATLNSCSDIRMETWNYTEMIAKAASGNTINPIQREAVQALGRPWTRMAPIADNFMKGGVWEDAVKAIDSRYDATFTLRYHTNWHRAGNTELYKN